MLTVSNSTVSGNSASSGRGGGLYNTANGALTVENATISNNSAKFGGGVYSDSSAGASKLNLLSAIVAKNSITSGGSGPDVDFSGGTITSYGHNLIGDGTDSALVNGSNGDQVGNAGTPIDPKLGSLGLNGGTTVTIFLLSGSPAISNGNCGGNLAATPPVPNVTTDQRGINRTNPCDVGAFESRFTPIVVTSLNDASGSCPSLTNCTLRASLALANLNTSATTITFGLSGTITVGSALTLNNTASILIDGSGQSIVIDGGHSVTDFSIASGATASLNDLVVQNSGSSGIVNSGTLTINNLILSKNNSSGNGGGIQNNGTLTLSNSTVSNNFASLGGAGLSNSGMATLTNTTFNGNNGNGYRGGGIGNDGNLTILDRTFSSNTAGTGSAIGSTAGNVVVNNSTISGNTNNALMLLGGHVTIANTTIANNGTGVDGSSNVVNLLSAIVAGNTGNADVGQIAINSLGHNLIGNATGATGLTNGVNGDQVGTSGSPIDPKLAALANNGGSTQTMALLPGSPAIGAGNCGGNASVTPNAPAVTTDQRGTARVNTGAGLGCDIGAYESGLQPNTATPTPTASSTPTAEPTVTATNTATPTGTTTTTATYSPTGTSASTGTATATQNTTSTTTGTVTVTTTPSITATASASSTLTPTNTLTCPTPTPLPSPTATSMFTRSPVPGCPSLTPMLTFTTTFTLSPTATATATLSPTATVTLSPTATATLIPAKIDTIGIYRSGTFNLRLHNSTGPADLSAAFTAGSKPYPIVGDWAGAGFDTIGVHDQNTGFFYLHNSNTAGSADETLLLGNPQDTPLSGRWQISATHAGVGVFRPGSGILYMKNALTSGYSDYSEVLGNPGDVGIAGDWTGKGFDSPGVYRPSATEFFLSNQVTSGIVYSDISFIYGTSTDLPIAGDWIAQGHDGVGMFRPTTGYVFLKNALTTGTADNSFTYGQASDVPIAGHWVLNYPPIAPLPTVPTSTPHGSVSVPGDNQIGG